MQELPLKDIQTKAHQLHDEGLKWHFHILTPTCSLNDKPQYAFVLECPERQLATVYYSDRAEKELGQELSPLLHGTKILNKDTAETDYVPSETVEKIIKRAQALNAQDFEWHHHVLFPSCRFNKHSPKFTLVFEDPQAGDALESLSDTEPTNDLKQIESLFYKK
jgi:hypothetical protein